MKSRRRVNFSDAHQQLAASSVRKNMDIDPKAVPIGQTVLLGETDFITTRFTRVSERKGFVEYFEPVDGCTVLKIEVDVYGESICDFQYIDRDYWTLMVDGRPMARSEEAAGTINVDAETRMIEIITLSNDSVN